MFEFWLLAPIVVILVTVVIVTLLLSSSSNPIAEEATPESPAPFLQD